MFNDYKECSKLPVDVRGKQRGHAKRANLYTNSIDTQEYNNAVIQKPEKTKPKPEPNRIIKKIAESMDAWQANRRIKNSRNTDEGKVDNWLCFTEGKKKSSIKPANSLNVLKPLQTKMKPSNFYQNKFHEESMDGNHFSKHGEVNTNISDCKSHVYIIKDSN